MKSDLGESVVFCVCKNMVSNKMYVSWQRLVNFIGLYLKSLYSKKIQQLATYIFWIAYREKLDYFT